MRRSLASAAMLVLALTLGACVGDDGAADEVDAGVDARAASLVASISERAAEKGSATVEFTMDVDGRRTTGTAAGRFGKHQRATAVTIDASGQPSQVRFVGGAVYVTVPQRLSHLVENGTKWINIGKRRINPAANDQAPQELHGIDWFAKQGDLMRTLALIKRLGTVTGSEKAKLDGRPVTRHAIDMRLGNKFEDFPMGLGKVFMDKYTAPDVESYQMTLWVGEDHLPIKLTMDLSELYAALTTGAVQPPAGSTVETPQAKVSGTVTYSAWGQPVDVEAPPEEQVGKIKTPQAPPPPNPAANPTATK